MMVLVSYDVQATRPQENGAYDAWQNLKKDFGQRVQLPMFECEVTQHGGRLARADASAKIG
jgi:CRISPR-associated endonuclease Cas2